MRGKGESKYIRSRERKGLGKEKHLELNNNGNPEI